MALQLSSVLNKKISLPNKLLTELNNIDYSVDVQNFKCKNMQQMHLTNANIVEVQCHKGLINI